jgi:hypothetical protein
VSQEHSNDGIAKGRTSAPAQRDQGEHGQEAKDPPKGEGKSMASAAVLLFARTAKTRSV